LLNFGIHERLIHVIKDPTLATSAEAAALR
jgi:hypothetical protein